MTARVLEMVSLFLKKSLEEGLDSEARQDLIDTLVEDGHNPNEVNAALTIVEHIQRRLEAPGSVAPAPKTNRLFMTLEELRLPVDVRGYIHHLVEMGVIDPVQREEMVEKVMMLEPDDLTVDDVENALDEILADQPRFLGQFDETVSEYYH